MIVIATQEELNKVNSYNPMLVASLVVTVGRGSEDYYVVKDRFGASNMHIDEIELKLKIKQHLESMKPLDKPMISNKDFEDLVRLGIQSSIPYFQPSNKLFDSDLDVVDDLEPF